MINVTKSYLPALDEYIPYLERIWASGQITNDGPLVRELEDRLGDYLGANHVVLTANGTLALQIAIKSLDLTGKIITTPFSYVASTSAVLAEKCEPVFVDIDRQDLCINTDLIQGAITPDVSAILAVHVFGMPCNVEEIARIANENKIKVIFDAAHAFGCQLDGKSLGTFGDITALSFHATKLFHTVEGGALVTNDDELVDRIRLIRAFGHRHDDHYCPGINAKNSELHAAMGLCVLPKISEIISQRKKVCESYDDLLQHLPVERPVSSHVNYSPNYAYYPIIFDTEEHLLNVKSALEKKNVFPRRYFFPSLTNLPYCSSQSCENSESVSARILCLPLFPELSISEQEIICSVIERGLS